MILTVLAVVCILAVMILILIPVIKWFRSSQPQQLDQAEANSLDDTNEEQVWG
jgi:predicted PurR-regulated permease PerM